MPAIKKGDVGKLSDADLKRIEKAQEFINQKLNREYRKGDGPVTIDFAALARYCGQLEGIILRHLKATYREAGWQVSEEHDQRDGSWLSFS